MRRLVVVHDSTDVAELLSELVSELGWESVHCPTDAALDGCLAHSHPDVILLSLWVDRPGGGWLIFERLRAGATTSSIPIILWPEHDVDHQRALTTVDRRTATIDPVFHGDDLLQVLDVLAHGSAIGGKAVSN